MDLGVAAVALVVDPRSVRADPAVARKNLVPQHLRSARGEIAAGEYLRLDEVKVAYAFRVVAAGLAALARPPLGLHDRRVLTRVSVGHHVPTERVGCDIDAHVMVF